MLAAAAVRGPLNPWQGKSFRDANADVGTGTNRVGFTRCAGAFRFRTYATTSVVDGLRSLAVDYDTEENPGFARTVYDELRPVGAGLWLGRGMRRRPGKGPQLLVWFALDSKQQDAPVVW